MLYTLRRTARIHYAQIRPMRTVHLSELQLHTLLDNGGSITMDCSEGVTCLCKWAGLHDPNGNHYDGAGYTGTLLGHLPHYTDPAAANVGALVVFGPPPGEHVAMVLRPGDDPLLWSHGGENGPIAILLSHERTAHEPPVTFLSIAGL